jgi:phosphohistidine phosphatase
MREAAWRPSLVLCSTAKRSRETLALLAGAAGWETDDPVVQYSDRLYLAAPEETISQLQELDGSVASVLVVGHNPGFHDISLMLADPESMDYARLLENFPTGALAVLRDDSKSWRSLGTSKMELLRFLVPRELVF